MSQSTSPQEITIQNEINHKKIANVHENRPTEILKKVRETYPKKDIWCYSGYLFDRDMIPGGCVHTNVTDEMLSYIDVLVDGEFKEALKDVTLVFRGSQNQRIINVQESKKQGKVVLEDY